MLARPVAAGTGPTGAAAAGRWRKARQHRVTKRGVHLSRTPELQILAERS
jgi:hypothetical protein